MRIAIVALVLVAAGCASAPPRIGTNMPHPFGCYAKVYDTGRFKGTTDFINGPRRYRSLTDLPNKANWSKRIRSVQVGGAAVVTVWTDRDFKGESLELRTDRAYSALTE